MTDPDRVMETLRGLRSDLIATGASRKQADEILQPILDWLKLKSGDAPKRCPTCESTQLGKRGTRIWLAPTLPDGWRKDSRFRHDGIECADPWHNPQERSENG